MKKRYRWRLVELMFKGFPPNINFLQVSNEISLPSSIFLCSWAYRAYGNGYIVLNLPLCHVTAVQQQPADGQLTARGKGLVCKNDSDGGTPVKIETQRE